jgi:uncharacterized membrane protein
MSKRGLYVILGAMAAYNALVALFMVAIGAFPVPVFLGLDVIGVWIAFSVSSRPAPSIEHIQVTHDEVRVMRRRAKAVETLWRSPTAFTRVELDPSREGAAALRVRLRTRSLRIGAMLGPAELETFAERLREAVRAALAERHA